MAFDVDAVDDDGGDLICSVGVIVVVVMFEMAFDSISINTVHSGHFKASQHSNLRPVMRVTHFEQRTRD